jgi:hypothetical protein
MNAKNKCYKNKRPNRTSILSRVALMLVFVIFFVSHYGYVVRSPAGM